MRKTIVNTEKFITVDIRLVKRAWKRAEKTIVITPEVFSKVFSPARLRLLLRIKENNIANIYQLAKSLRRPYESVHRDIQYLAGFKLIKIKTKGKKRIPYTDEPIKIPQF